MSFFSNRKFKIISLKNSCVIINFSSDIILSLIFTALPLINLLISLLDFSNLDRIIRSIISSLLSISFELIFIDGKFEPSELPENASLAACSEFLAAFSP